MRALLALILIVGAASAFGGEPEASSIIARSVAANEADWKVAPDFACFVREQEDKGAKVYEKLMILGSPYERLVSVNGKPLSPEDQSREEQKLQEVIARRQSESKEKRAQRIAKYQKERKRDHLLMDQITKAFDFTLLGEQKLDSREVYVLKATPRPDYRPPNVETKVLTGMQGKLWVDTKEFQWVKVEAEAIRPVSIEGFLAVVEPGTRFELEKAPVAHGVWLPRHFAMKSLARIFFFLSKNQQENETYFNCRQQGSIPRAEISSNQQISNR